MSAAPLDEHGLPRGYPFREDWEVSPRQAQEELQSASPPILLDCRRDDEWDLVRLPGAVHIPLDQIERRADELEDDEGGRNRPVIIYCHHGRRSLRAAAALKALGYSDVRSLAGGIDLWSQSVDAGVKRY